MISNKDILSDGENTINTGFSILQTTYTILVFNFQITNKSLVKLKSQDLKCYKKQD